MSTPTHGLLYSTLTFQSCSVHPYPRPSLLHPHLSELQCPSLPTAFSTPPSPFRAAVSTPTHGLLYLTLTFQSCSVHPYPRPSLLHPHLSELQCPSLPTAFSTPPSPFRAAVSTPTHGLLYSTLTFQSCSVHPYPRPSLLHPHLSELLCPPLPTAFSTPPSPFRAAVSIPTHDLLYSTLTFQSCCVHPYPRPSLLHPHLSELQCPSLPMTFSTPPSPFRAAVSIPTHGLLYSTLTFQSCSVHPYPRPSLLHPHLSELQCLPLPMAFWPMHPTLVDDGGNPFSSCRRTNKKEVIVAIAIL